MYHDRCNINWSHYEKRDLTALESCRLYDLPDLDQDNPWVREELIKWLHTLHDEYGFDGYRMDSVLHVKKKFLKEL